MEESLRRDWWIYFNLGDGIVRDPGTKNEPKRVVMNSDINFVSIHELFTNDCKLLLVF